MGVAPLHKAPHLAKKNHLYHDTKKSTFKSTTATSIYIPIKTPYPPPPPHRNIIKLPTSISNDPSLPHLPQRKFQPQTTVRTAPREKRIHILKPTINPIYHLTKAHLPRYVAIRMQSMLKSKVAEMIHQIFGDMLFTPEKDCLEEFPSPESLKRRVMISTKPPKEYLKGEKPKEKGNESHEKDPSVEPWGGEIPTSLDVKDDSDDSDDDDDDEDLQSGNVAPEYKSLIAIHAGKGKGGLDDWLKVDPDKVRRLSLSEHELEKSAETHGPQIVRFTQRNILRVYPKGIRFDSSNYNPLIGWMHGAQMVAFNMQGHGRSLWLMQGMFRGNGGCGYVKKPDLLLTGGNEVFDPRVSLPVKMTIKITIYMGEGWYYDFKHTHFDAYSPPDFYVRVGIAGVPADSIMKKSKTVEDSWNPTWNEEFEFPLTVPELALLRIEVHEYDISEKDDFAGQTCLPVTEMSKGIRSVPLYSQQGDMYQSVKLLMWFDVV
ncbi:phosphoinositide phospholipase C 2-like protein, partial [Tanacetum coccineum]